MDKDFRTMLTAGLILLVLAFCVTDCSLGKKRICPGEVREHVFHPPYVTLSCHSDKHGSHCHPVYHPAQYHLLVLCQQPYHVADVNAGRLNYARYRDGDPVQVHEQVGRWSHIIWLKSIGPDPNQY